MTIFEDRVFKEVTNIKWGHKGGALDWDPGVYREKAIGKPRRMAMGAKPVAILIFNFQSPDCEKQISIV